MSETVGHFSLWGDFEAAEITAALKLQPSCVYPKGTWFEGAEFAAKTATWDLHCPEDLSMGEQIEYLLGMLLPHADELRHLAERYTADINISGQGAQVMELKAGILQKLAHLHLNLNCFYNCDEESNGD